MKFIVFAVFVILMFNFVFVEFDFEEYNFGIYLTIVLLFTFSVYKFYVRNFLIKLGASLPNKPEDKVLFINDDKEIYINKTEKFNGEFTYVNVGDTLHLRPNSYFKFTVKEKHLRKDNFITIEKSIYGTKKSHFVFAKNFLNITTKLVKYGFYIYFSIVILNVSFSLYETSDERKMHDISWYNNYAKYAEQVKYPQYIDPITKKVYKHDEIDIICYDNHFFAYSDDYSNKLDDEINCKNNNLYSKVDGSIFGEGFYKGGANINEGLYYYVSSGLTFVQFNEKDDFYISNSAKLIELKVDDIINVDEGSLLIEKDKFEPYSNSDIYPAADYIVGENLEPGTYNVKAFNYVYREPFEKCDDLVNASYTLVNKEQFFQIFNGNEKEYKYSIDIRQCSGDTIELKNGDYLMLEDSYLIKIDE